MQFIQMSSGPTLFHLDEKWRYSPPSNPNEVFLSSRVNAMVFDHLEATIKDILGGGRRRDGVIRDGRFIVGVTGDWVSEDGGRLPSGGWYDSWGRFGDDPIELLAYLSQESYRWAIDVLAERLKIASSDGETGQLSHLDGWVQERSPLFVPEDFRGPLPRSRWVDYLNPTGRLIARAIRLQPFFGEETTLHRTLRRHRNGHRSQWMDMFHEKPYPLFNAHLLYRDDWWKKVAFLLSDEFLAYECGEHPDFVFSAIPGGLANLMDADLSALSGRQVCIEMGHEHLKYGRQFKKRLESAGVASAVFKLGMQSRLIPFDEIEEISAERGVELLELQLDRTPKMVLAPVDFTELMALQMPEREYVISPILQKQSLAMIHAPRGIGKTYVALSIALAVATGGAFLRWNAPEPRRVLYLDGEMPAEFMQIRLRSMTSGMGGAPADGFFRLLNPDLLGGPMPDISSEEGQATIEPYLTGVELVVLDNLSTLCRSTRENEGDSWGPVQSWLLELRRRGIAVLVVHHSGKNGSQRGTSRREDVLDTVLNLRRPQDYSASQGARFEVHIEKGRSLFGQDAEPFEAQLEVVDGVAAWSIVDQVDPVAERAIELLRARRPLRAIEAELGISRSTLGRWRQKLAENGELGV
jgi:hypothetical protein